MPFSAISRKAVGTSNFGISNLGISNLGTSNLGISKADAATATGFDLAFGVAAVETVFSAMTHPFDWRGHSPRSGRQPSANRLALFRSPPHTNIHCALADHD